VTCGEGVKTRTRGCNSPPPSHGGRVCHGEERDSQACSGEPCREPVELPPQCGETTITQNRITNGQPAKRNAWPWQAAIGYNDTEGNIDYLCGATLITKRHVVTAAHCIQDSMATVLLGEHILGNDTDGANPEEYKIEKIIPHENYNPRTFDNDIAVIKFDTDVEFKVGIKPVCLPSKTPGLLEENFERKGVYITGWGAVRFRGPTSNILLQGNILVSPQSSCKEKFSQFKNVEIGDTKICARDVRDRIDACQGDSGGPMVISERGPDKKYRFHLIGVVSFGYRCNVPGFPGVYTRVTEYDEWIQNKIKEE